MKIPCITNKGYSISFSIALIKIPSCLRVLKKFLKTPTCNLMGVQNNVVELMARMVLKELAYEIYSKFQTNSPCLLTKIAVRQSSRKLYL